jgi:hypothetical protein
MAQAAQQAAQQEQPASITEGMTLQEYVDSINPDNEFRSDDQRIEFLMEHDAQATASVEKMLEVIKEYPELGEVFMGDKPPQAAFAARFGSGDEYQQYLDEANDKDVVQIRESRKAEQTAKAESEAALRKRAEGLEAQIQSWGKRRGITQEQLEEFDRTLAAVASALLDFNLTDKELDMLFRMLSYDTDVAAAEQKGYATREKTKAQAAAKSKRQPAPEENEDEYIEPRGDTKLPDYMYD